tara:strand:- start:182 stop:460 length:279 start_codon:yes stop_codon:yes gene_type:complete
MDILKGYLIDKIDTLYENTTKIDNDRSLLGNKLFEKKIEYMNNYLQNSIVEIEELNDYTKKNLLNNDKFVNCKLNEYKSMEDTINNYVTHNL